MNMSMSNRLEFCSKGCSRLAWYTRNCLVLESAVLGSISGTYIVLEPGYWIYENNVLSGVHTNVIRFICLMMSIESAITLCLIKNVILIIGEPCIP
jgi:hypothetical protein